MRLEQGDFADDCGACALATWASVKYDTAHEALWPGVKPRENVGYGHGTYPRQLRAGIRRLGLGEWTWTRASDWRAIPNGSIVEVLILDNGKEMPHWCVKSRTGLLLCAYSPSLRKLPPNYHVKGYLEEVK